MLIALSELVKRYDVKITGVLHLGAHVGEERDAYAEAGVPKVVWVEGNPKLSETLTVTLSGYPGQEAYCVLLDEREGTVMFHEANNGQSSSILELGTHLRHHPEVNFVSRTLMPCTTVDAMFEQHEWSGLNFWNLDLQGAELRVLRGATESLESCDYLYIEVNDEEVYVDCALVRDLDEFLIGFDRVETAWTPHHWGDAFYVRRSR